MPIRVVDGNGVTVSVAQLVRIRHEIVDIKACIRLTEELEGNVNTIGLHRSGTLGERMRGSVVRTKACVWKVELTTDASAVAADFDTKPLIRQTGHSHRDVQHNSRNASNVTTLLGR